VAGTVSGLYVGVTAAGAVLVWSGWKGATVSATVRALLNGNLNVSDTEAITTATASGGSGSSSTATAGGSSQNYLTIAQYLVSNGYSNAGAAGVVGCVAGESSGSPEAEATPGNPSGGAGLIQWTGSSYDAYKPQVTGNASADLDQQLPLIIAYNDAQGANLVAMLNALTDPVQAADFYSEYFERPAVTDSDVVASVATSVYAQLTQGPGSQQPVSQTTVHAVAG
jgi:hypothetical protein